MNEILLVKLGGSLLTDKTRAESVREEHLARLAGEVARADTLARTRGLRLILGHGSGSFGHAAAAAAGLGRGPLDEKHLVGASRTQERARALHALVIGALLDAGAAPFSLAPGSLFAAEGGELRAADLAPLDVALAAGFLPVVYGDVIADRSWCASIASTEAVFVALTLGLAPRVTQALWLGETSGVWDAQGETLPEISTLDQAGDALGGSRGTDVTGGMRHRVQAALELATLGVTSTIADGRKAGAIERFARGEAIEGTRIPAR